MITIVSGTNREHSSTEAVSMKYGELLAAAGNEGEVFSLRHLPHDMAFAELYGRRSSAMTEIIEKYIAPVDKFVFVVPEYNGSFPGILKLFIDAVEPKYWREKRSAIVGVSSGHSGNLRGLEHLTGVLHYLRMHVHYQKPKLSGIEGLMDDGHKLTDGKTVALLAEHAAMIGKW